MARRAAWFNAIAVDADVDFTCGKERIVGVFDCTERMMSASCRSASLTEECLSLLGYYYAVEMIYFD